MRRALCLLIILPLFSQAQKQANIWYFGNKCGLDFSSGSPVVLYDGQTSTDSPQYGLAEGCASICDSTGQLLFYTSGHTIWTANHARMLNGSGLFGGGSSTQSSIIVPRPGSDSLYYVFTSDEFQKYEPNSTSGPSLGYRYNVVDMCLDSGRGAVIPNQKNILLMDTSTEKLCACREPSGNGYWIVGHKMFSNEFRAWHLTAGGITNTVVTNIGFVHGSTSLVGSAMGQMKFSPNCDKLALVMGNIDPCLLEIFDFNPATGVLTNACRMRPDSALIKRGYGLEFSPDGTKLYCPTGGGAGPNRIHQYDLTAGNCNAVMASDYLIYQSSDNYLLNGMQAAPDGKIYLLSKWWSQMGRIVNPNLAGAAVSFDSVAVDFDTVNINSPIRRFYTTPSFVAGFKYHNTVVSCRSTTPDPTTIAAVERMESGISVYPNPVSDLITVNISDGIALGALQLSIYDVTGREIKNVLVSSHQQNFDLADVADGLYVYRFRQRGYVIKTGKLVVE